jgi:cleavage and polyadenylation specificity factor subunit 4
VFDTASLRISLLHRDNFELTILLPAMAAILSQGPGPEDLSRQILEHQAPEYTFTFSPFLFQTYRHGLSPNRPTCKAYLQGHCPLGAACPDKHTTANSNSNFNNLVCKHWLRGLCKKGESCEFLHEYNLRKMPECNFFVRNGYCSNGGTWSSLFWLRSLLITNLR